MGRRRRVIYMDDLDERIYDLERAVLRYCFRNLRGGRAVDCNTIEETVRRLEHLTILRDTEGDDGTYAE